MKKTTLLLLFLVCVGLGAGLLLSCVGSVPASQPKQVEEGGDYHVMWVPVSPPGPGMRCWMAWWKANDGMNEYGPVAIGTCLWEQK